MSQTDRKQLERMRRAIAELPERTRAVYRFHLFEGLDYPAIAERLGIDCGEVERHIAEAIVAIDRAFRAAGADFDS